MTYKTKILDYIITCFDTSPLFNDLVEFLRVCVCVCVCVCV